jgi:LysR family glycine cleavage system transcriptional activator
LTNHGFSRKPVEKLHPRKRMMIRHRNLNGLRMFHQAAVCLNFGHAAEVLNVTQGAVAQQIRALEAELGVQLFHRKARGLSLTSQGEALSKEIAHALQQIDAALSAVTAVSNTVALTVTPSFAAKWLGPRLPSFMDEHPEIDLQITADQKVTDFKTDGMDMAVRQGMPPQQKDVEWCFLGPHDLVAVAAHSLIAQYPSDVPLESYPLIEDSHRLWAAALEGAAIQNEVRILKVNQTSLALDAARRGQGVALVPRCYLDPVEDHMLTQMRRVAEQEGRGFYLVWSKQRVDTPAMVTFRNWLISGFQRP